MREKIAIVIGAGPAGLTAAYELLTRSNIRPIVLEATDMLGGIARTVNYKGNRIDIGGHRFFSKSDRVMNWWADMLPMEAGDHSSLTIAYHGKTRQVNYVAACADPEKTDDVMLVRRRKSRIYFLRRFFDYPLTLSWDTVQKLGFVRMMKIGLSYLHAQLLPIRPETTLESFFLNRFGIELYRTFFKSYTEKVWGVPCEKISAAWGAQRIKTLSIFTAVANSFSRMFRPAKDIRQKDVETSLVEKFLYPKYGPGQMWDTCARKVSALGGVIRMQCAVRKIHVEDNAVTAVTVWNDATGCEELLQGDYYFSTMPIKELIRGMENGVPARVREISEGLIYRDFITVGLLLDDLKIHEDTPQGKKLITDNWIYVQEPDVSVGRLQIFNNWSPYMVADQSKVWMGLEYFCFGGDDLWKRSDEQMTELAIEELARIGIVDAAQVRDHTVIRMPKAYPAYFGSFERLGELREWIDRIENLFLIGRNGMHRYNNQDHSMLTAMVAVDNVIAGRTDKSNIWDVNTEQDYHEEK